MKALYEKKSELGLKRGEDIVKLNENEYVYKSRAINIFFGIRDKQMYATNDELLYKAEKCQYPLHVGITESGTVYSGNIKSSVGLGIILHEGIGNTIRVSLTGDPTEEIRTKSIPD